MLLNLSISLPSLCLSLSLLLLLLSLDLRWLNDSEKCCLMELEKGPALRAEEFTKLGSRPESSDPVGYVGTSPSLLQEISFLQERLVATQTHYQ